MQQSRECSRFNVCVYIGLRKAKGVRRHGKSSEKIENCDLDNTDGVLKKLRRTFLKVKSEIWTCFAKTASIPNAS